MKRILIGTALALFGLVPAIGSADCGADHAAMAYAAPAGKTTVAQASEASKAPAAAVTKASAKKAKPVKKTTTASRKADGSTVVAKAN